MRRGLRAALIVIAVAIAGYIVWDRVEAHQLAGAVAEIAARGEPTGLTASDTPLPSPAHEEAARLYGEAASRAREISQRDGRMTRLDVDAVVGNINVREIEELYKPDAPALQFLDRADALPFAGFGDTVDGPEWMNVQGLQALAALSALRADVYAYRGEGDAAARALAVSVRVQRTMPELFYRSIVAGRQIGSLRILLRHSAPSAGALASLQRAFAEWTDRDDLDKDLIQRRARLLDDPVGGAVPGGTPDLVAFLFHPFLLHRVRVQIDQFDDVIAAARQPWPDKFGAMEALAAEARFSPQRRSFLGSLLSGEVPNVAVASASPGFAGLALAARRVAVTTLAIERYRRAHVGALPPALAALVPELLPAIPVDPFTGGPLIYKPGPDSYLLYSVDVNRIDNGGQFYGTGAMATTTQLKTRDFGINVPLTPRPVRE